MPKMEFRSNAKPSLYAYPPLLKKEKETLKEKVRWREWASVSYCALFVPSQVATAVLSVTAKAKAKEKEKKKAAAPEEMEVTVRTLNSDLPLINLFVSLVCLLGV